MKKILTFTILSIFLLSIVYAQEIATQEDITLAGITPDSVLYPLEIALEKITELFSENVKLKHAIERLAEVKVMISREKLPEAEVARAEFEVIRSNMKNMSQVKEHKILLDNLGKKIIEISSVRNNLTAQDITEIKNLIEIHKSDVMEEVGNIRDFIIKNKGIKLRE